MFWAPMKIGRTKRPRRFVFTERHRLATPAEVATTVARVRMNIAWLLGDGIQNLDAPMLAQKGPKK